MRMNSLRGSKTISGMRTWRIWRDGSLKRGPDTKRLNAESRARSSRWVCPDQSLSTLNTSKMQFLKSVNRLERELRLKR